MKRIIPTVILCILLTPAVSLAGEMGFRGWGPRVGVTLDPDQIHFGAHADFGHLAERIRFQPNVELGLGDGLTVLALNLEGVYRFRSRWDVWTPYLGSGFGVNFIGTDDDGLADGSTTEAGINVLGGIDRGLSNGSRFFLEAKVGLFDTPDFKFTVGWTFPHGSARPIPGDR